jgi:hypothetical protein
MSAAAVTVDPDAAETWPWKSRVTEAPGAIGPAMVQA